MSDPNILVDLSHLETYIKEKANGRNLETMLILKSLLEKGTATEKSIYQTTQSFLNLHKEKLSSSYNKLVGSSQRFFFEDQTHKSLSGLINAGVVTTRGNNRTIVDLSCSLENPERAVLLRMCAIEIMRVLKINNPSELVELGLQDLSRYLDENNDIEFADVDVHGGWEEGQPPTYEMKIQSMLENFEMSVREFVKTVYKDNDNWIKEKVGKEIRTVVYSKMEEKQQLAKRRGNPITLDRVSQFLNSTDFGTLITIIFANPKDFAKALDDPDLIEIRNWLLNIKRIRDPRSHADETVPVDQNEYNKAKFFVSSALKIIDAYMKNYSSSSSSSSTA